MKKILSIMLAALLVFALCACQGGTDAGKDSSLETPTSSKLALTSKPSSQVEESSSKLDKELEAVGGGPELLKFAEAFAEIPVGYLGTLDDDYSAFKDRADFKDVPPLDMAIFICNYLERERILWSNYQGTFGYEGYRVPAEDLNTYAKKLFGYEYDFSKIKETDDGSGGVYKYIPSSKAFDVGIFGSMCTKGICEYKGMHKKISEDEYLAEFEIWHKEYEKPDGVEGKDWRKDDEVDSIYWEYDDSYMLTIKKIDGEWKYVSFLEIDD
ncbi:MAG: hypothetical protein IIX89_01800 [Oscillospiraceae bacterium]|nr:hypothetical protein [Oscillospiraceae bacterium]